jgi:hypothetical protein
MSFELIAQSYHPLGGFFLARLPDGSILAGRDEAGARAYPDAATLYDAMHDFALRGHHWAWNLCYEVQALVERE